MRVDFNILVVDDDYNKVSGSWVIDLKDELSKSLLNKGFVLHWEYLDKIKEDTDISSIFNGRIDYILSDNNIGEGHTGIDIFIDLSKRNRKHDFLLYTKSDTKQIIDVIYNKLVLSNNPNFLNKFSFLSLSTETEQNIARINQIVIEKIDKRIELGSLRVLYSDSFAKIELKIMTILSVLRVNLKKAIQMCFQKGKLPLSILVELEYHRVLRNSIIHKHEYYNLTECTYCLDIEVSDFASWATPHMSSSDLSKTIIKENEIDSIRNRFVCLLNDLESYGIKIL